MKNSSQFSCFVDVTSVSIDFDWLLEDSSYYMSDDFFDVNLTPLLYFEQLEHLWISSHMDTHAFLFVPDTIDRNLSVRAKHLHLTASMAISNTFFNRFKYLETLDMYDYFLFPQMTQFSTILEAVSHSPLRSISVKNPSAEDSFASNRLKRAVWTNLICTC